MVGVEEEVRAIVAEELGLKKGEVGAETEVSVEMALASRQPDPVLRRIQDQFGTDFSPRTKERYWWLAAVLVAPVPAWVGSMAVGALFRVVPESPPWWTERTAFLGVVVPVWVGLVWLGMRWLKGRTTVRRRVRVGEIERAVRWGRW